MMVNQVKDPSLSPRQIVLIITGLNRALIESHRLSLIQKLNSIESDQKPENRVSYSMSISFRRRQGLFKVIGMFGRCGISL